MTSTTLLLIQNRFERENLATVHELGCIKNKFENKNVNFIVKNIFEEKPTIEWLDGINGVIIGGSGSFGVPDLEEELDQAIRTFYMHLINENIPTFAICFGHQLLGHVLGSDKMNINVVCDYSKREVGTTKYFLTEAGQQDPLFSKLGNEFCASTGHTDYVVDLPENLTLLATNDMIEHQAFKVNSSNFYSVQFHPELRYIEARERYTLFSESKAELRKSLQNDLDQFFEQNEYINADDLLLISFYEGIVLGNS
eukprot:TRINITY_DN10845_c0_g1_i1.p1 TRINITY_DN10845_c0_g1~~TRINITY_DN10845_c0_g1_i1.p1  ORF type:complete len:254 (+),score=66.58 TRINITY_DN10845_c0_g1_i1:47-808(+)